MDRLFRDGAQEVILAAGAGRPGGPAGPTIAGVYGREVTRRDALLLLLLSAIWGASFLFIKLGVDAFEPSVVAFGRLVFGARAPARTRCRGAVGSARSEARLVPLVVLGALNNAVPFWLLGFAETRLDSGLTAVIQAAAPIFTVVLASRIDPSQRVAGAASSASASASSASLLLVGVQSGGELLGGARSDRHRLLLRGLRPLRRPVTMRGIPPLAGLARPARLRRRADGPVRDRCSCPETAPPAKAWLAVVALGVLGSGIAYLLYFALIASAGASRAILVTYLVPAFALVYGAVFLDEAVTPSRSPGSASCSPAPRSQPGSRGCVVPLACLRDSAVLATRPRLRRGLPRRARGQPALAGLGLILVGVAVGPTRSGYADAGGGVSSTN